MRKKKEKELTMKILPISFKIGSLYNNIILGLPKCIFRTNCMEKQKKRHLSEFFVGDIKMYD